MKKNKPKEEEDRACSIFEKLKSKDESKDGERCRWR